MRGEARKAPASTKDVAGFCKSAATEEIAAHGYILTPGRYVGAEAVQDNGGPFEQKIKRLAAQLEEQFRESDRIQQAIRTSLSAILEGSLEKSAK